MAELPVTSLGWGERRRTLKRLRSLIRNPVPAAEAWQSELSALVKTIGSQGRRGIVDIECLAQDSTLQEHIKAWLLFVRADLLVAHGTPNEAINALHAAVRQKAAGDSRVEWMTKAAHHMHALGRSDLAIEFCREVVHSKATPDWAVQDSLRVLAKCINVSLRDTPDAQMQDAHSAAVEQWITVRGRSFRDDVRAFCDRELLFLHLNRGALHDAIERIDGLVSSGAHPLESMEGVLLFELAFQARIDRVADSFAALQCFFRCFQVDLRGNPSIRGPLYYLAADCFRRQGREVPAFAAFELAKQAWSEGLAGSVSGEIPLDGLYPLAEQAMLEVTQHFAETGPAAFPRLPDAAIISASMPLPGIRQEIVAACDAALQASLFDRQEGTRAYARHPLSTLDPAEHLEECTWVQRHIVACGIPLHETPLGQKLQWLKTLSEEIYPGHHEEPKMPASIKQRLSDACRCAYVDKNMSKASDLFMDITTDVAEQLQTEDRIRALCWIACGAHRVGCIGTGERIVVSAMRIAEIYSSQPLERLRLLGLACKFLAFNGGCNDFPRLVVSVARDAKAQCLSLKASAPGYSDRDRGEMISILWDFEAALRYAGES